MELLASFYETNPFWLWVSLAGLLLAVEVATGAQFLLWPTVAAGVTALFALTPLDTGLPVEIGLFAGLTIVTSLVSRRFIARAPVVAEPDINDPLIRLVGRRGASVGAFAHGRGRVLVEGKEWAAETAEGVDPEAGEAVEVVSVVDGSSLRVRRA